MDNDYFNVLRLIQNIPYCTGYSDSYSSKVFLCKYENNKDLINPEIQTRQGIIIVIKNLFPTAMITKLGIWKCWGNGSGVPRRDREVKTLLDLLGAKKFRCPYPCSYRKYEKQPCSYSCKHSLEEYFSVGKVNGEILPDVILNL